MPSKFSDILTLEEVRDKVILQVGKALYNIDPTRSVLQNYKDLPSVGTHYVLVEGKTTTPIGIGSDKGFYYKEDDDTYIMDTITSHSWNIDITAAYNDPELFLLKFATYIRDDDYWFDFFNKEEVGIQTVSPVVDSSIPVDGGGEWEVRYKCTITVNYRARNSHITNGLESIAPPTITIK